MSPISSPVRNVGEGRRREAAKILRIFGFTVLLTPFALLAVHLRQPVVLLGSAAAFVVGSVCLSVSLRMRGYRRDSRQMLLLGAFTALCLVGTWAWMVS